MHGHDFLLLGSGNGTFDYATDFPTLNLHNPARRDVVTLPKSSGSTAGGWLVIGFPLDNPGIWVLVFPSVQLIVDDSLSYCVACQRRPGDAIC